MSMPILSRSAIAEEEQQKNNKGKRKIAIEPITNKTRKQVTFSKRRVGLFKKASELCSLCGSQIAILTFSGAGKLFSFGHPSTDSVIHRYLQLCGHSNYPHPTAQNNHHDHQSRYSQQYKEVLSQIEEEKKKGEGVVGASSNGSNPRGHECGFWWDEPIDGLGLIELEQLKVALEGLRNQVASKIDEIHRPINVVPQIFDFGPLDWNLVPQAFDFSSMDHGVARDNGVHPLLETDPFI